ncbi:alpha/beta hydrolase [Halobacillus locisalis]|uniref:Alpha/beta hydrolase n=1 Tax=Halobacillus locisalis TaxID=220753 RepID=A0A838CTN9_9BACI|nr:alpha/beta hydrolase [Halobacillus locisalis]MBA2175437.1 alpha/beta hydrolase [Halobacillus locisalis]
MLEYKVLGDNPAKENVVLLHGIGGSANIFFPQIKAYKEHFNVIVLHLRGHKKSPSVHDVDDFSFHRAAQDVLDVLDEVGVEKAHFVGISLGSVLTHQILAIAPERVESAVLGGAITKMNLTSKFLFTVGKLCKNFMPHMWLYSLFARILMPRENHRESRNAFIKEASQMKREEFMGWYDIVHNVRGTYSPVPKTAAHVPKLYVMGEGDHMFKRDVTKDIQNTPNSRLIIVSGAGHVVNLDQTEAFNECSLAFMQSRGGVQQSTLDEKAKVTEQVNEQ